MRNRVPAFILALAVTLAVSVGVLAADDYYGSDGVFADYGIMPLATVSDFPVFAFCTTSTEVASTSTFTAGNLRLYTPSSYSVSNFFGYSIRIGPSYSDGYLHVLGLRPAFRWTGGTSGSWTTTSISGSNVITGPSYYFFSPSSDAYLRLVGQSFGSTDDRAPYGFQQLDGSTIYVPAHSGTIYLYVGTSISPTSGTSYSMGAIYESGGSITWRPNPVSSLDSNLKSLSGSVATESTLSKILSSLSSLVGSVGGLTPLEQFESDYLDNFSDQLSKTEEALSPSNSALPNGGDIGGFIDDVSSGLGLSGSSFNPSEFESATSGFSGVDSIGVGGPWEFFTQAVADDMAGDSPMSLDLDYDPILAWLERAEGRYGVWVLSNP